MHYYILGKYDYKFKTLKNTNSILRFGWFTLLDKSRHIKLWEEIFVITEATKLHTAEQTATWKWERIDQNVDIFSVHSHMALWFLCVRKAFL